ncbi:MAG: helix-turn-helix transcriptional regulator [Bacillota bacterium]
MVKYLKLLRVLSGMTQKQLAAKTGISAPAISSIERGYMRPYPAWRKRLSAVFEVQEEVLFAEVKDDAKASL